MLLPFPLFFGACSTFPDPHFQRHTFPENAYIGDVKDRPYTVVGLVKTRVDYQTLDVGHEEQDLCTNYFNKGARDLLKLARSKGAEAVVDVRSVVFFEDGKSKTYPDPECSDDGQNGQILMQGIAVKWKPSPSASPSPAVSPSRERPFHSAIPVSAKEWPLVAPSAQKFRSLVLKQERDGLDGGIRILSDPTRVVLFTNAREVLDEQKFQAKKLWLTSEFLRSSSERTILLSELTSTADARNGDVKTVLYELHGKKLEPEMATDSGSGSSDHLLLSNGLHSSWRLSEESSPSGARDILQVSAQPDSNQISFVRFHYAGPEKGWISSARAEAGSWNSGQAFPSEEKFPPAAHL